MSVLDTFFFIAAFQWAVSMNSIYRGDKKSSQGYTAAVGFIGMLVVLAIKVFGQ